MSMKRDPGDRPRCRVYTALLQSDKIGVNISARFNSQSYWHSNLVSLLGNAFVPVGARVEGAMAQEENMFRLFNSQTQKVYDALSVYSLYGLIRVHPKHQS